MNAKTKQEVIDIVSIVFCVIAICMVSYFSMDTITEGMKSYMESMCDHPRVRMCINY